MSISVLGDMNITVVETFDPPVSSGDATVTVNGYNEDGVTLTATSSVPASKYSYTSVNLSSGALTLNLAALAGRSADQTVVGTGLKPQFLKLLNPSTNANDLSFTKGASSGSTLLGSAWSFTLKPGQSAMFYLADAAPDVASGDRTIDVSGTGAQAVRYAVILG